MGSSSSTAHSPREQPAPGDTSGPPSLHAHGLLAGVAADASHYSPRLPDLRAAGALLTTRGLLWETAQQDAAARGMAVKDYVQGVKRAAAAFMDAKALYDRADTMATLGDLMGDRKGAFVLFLGGKDLGKSLMLRALAARLSAQGHRAVIVDARATGADLAAGIIHALKSDQGFFSTLLELLPQNARAVVAAAANFSLPGSGGVASAVFAPPSLRELLEGFSAACSASNTFPVLIFDEANRALPSTPGDAAECKATLDVLHQLTRLTKQESRMNVLLAASEHTEPFRLAALGFNTAHMSRTVVACEVPPAEMRVLLTHLWHCGPALAEGLMALFGGHVWQTHLALAALALEGPAFKAIAGFSPISGDGVSACLAAMSSGGPHMGGLESWLHELATHGFVTISSRDDPRVELLSKHDVGGVISESASTPGVPPEAWEAGSGELLVAASQGMRLLLARALMSRRPR